MNKTHLAYSTAPIVTVSVLCSRLFTSPKQSTAFPSQIYRGIRPDGVDCSASRNSVDTRIVVYMVIGSIGLCAHLPAYAALLLVDVSA